MFNQLDSILDGVSSVYTKTIKLNESFIDFASRFANDHGTVVLLSNNETDCGKYNILGYKPWMHFYTKHLKSSIIIGKKKIEFEANPLETLRYLLKICDMGDISENHIPIKTGFMGYLSYDLKNHLEKLPLTTIDDFSLPDICLFAPSIIAVHNISENIINIFVSNKKGDFKSQGKNIEIFEKKIRSTIPTKKKFFADGKNCKSNLTHDEYINAVKKIKKYISDGHVYQVNMSHRFDTRCEGDGFTFFKMLYNINPASFFAYINVSNHQVISSSPERLIMRNKNIVETRPIKGTCPRGKTAENDKLMKNNLINSTKNNAELSMIVDLMRNDLGKVCQSDSIDVKEHGRVEAYHNVFHLVSIIQGELTDSSDNVDLIKAVFPGGSITGCPKIRSMEIIDELEVNSRHIYTGSIGYISFHNTMDLSVAIRTATICNNQVNFSVGGGIVYDSDPEEEFNETLHKGQSIMDIFNSNLSNINKNVYDYLPWGWCNGIVKKFNTINIPIRDLGLMYGFGFFETILVENKHIYFLNEHIKRLKSSWINLFKISFPKLSWDVIIRQVIEMNEVENKTIIVKIVVTRGSNISNTPFNGSIYVVAKPYKNRLSRKNKGGLNVAVYSEPRQTPLAAHKTLNHLYYHIAGLWAIDNGFDEAIILNPDGTVSEGNSSNITLIYKRNVILPKSKFVLPGITINKVIIVLKSMNYNIITKIVTTADLLNADGVFLTNSIMGILPVISINNKNIKNNINLAKTINKKIFNSDII